MMLIMTVCSRQPHDLIDGSMGQRGQFGISPVSHINGYGA